MTVADVPATGQLFLKIFRGIQATGTPEFYNYLKALAFKAPLYSEVLGSFVYAQEDGRIRSAVIAIPMQFVAHDRIIAARLLCAYMSDAQNDAAGAAALSLTVRAKHQELAFSDSASPTSRAHMKAMGGVVLTMQNLEWIRTLRPLGASVGRLERKFRRRIGGLSDLMRPLDAVLRAISARIAPAAVQDMHVSDMPLEAFLDQAPGLIAHYSVRPLWPRNELAWLVELASQNTSFGPLQIRAVHQRDGLVGCFLFYGQRGRPANILNVLALKGKETKVVAAMVKDLDRIGCTEAVGRAQPALMEGLAAQRMLTFRHKAFVCLTTRHADIALAAERGDIYIGGLAGESWSRLMSDF